MKMKKNSLTKIIIHLLIVLIMMMILLMIAIIIYSIKYWPDVHNYITSDIKIKRIPTLSEMNLTIIDERTVFDEVTDNYYIASEDSVTDLFDNDYFSLYDVEYSRENGNEADHRNEDHTHKESEYIDPIYRDINGTVSTTTKVIKDLIDESELTTSQRNDVEILIQPEIFMQTNNYKEKEEYVTKTIFPWVAAIFIKNGTNDSFKYYCDGALLTDKVIVTAARCLQSADSTVTADDIIVLLGKNSLQNTSDNEQVKRVQIVHVHENFTKDGDNDVGVLTLEDAVEFTDSVQPARLGSLKEYDDAFTTGWAFTGDLSLIKLQEGNKSCVEEIERNHTFCAVYNIYITVCPSYGGLYVVENNKTWYLHGLRTADPTDREICINKPITFTALESFSSWLSHIITLIV